jgi:hypothetical protein
MTFLMLVTTLMRTMGASGALKQQDGAHPCRAVALHVGLFWGFGARALGAYVPKQMIYIVAAPQRSRQTCRELCSAWDPERRSHALDTHEQGYPGSVMPSGDTL